MAAPALYAPGHEGGSASLIAALLAGSEKELAEELEPAVEAFIGNAVFRYVAEEALVAISVTAIFFALAFVAPYLPSVSWAIAAAGAVLMWYLVHFARGLVSTWPLARALFLLRGAPFFRFALFVLARHAITLLETKMEEVGRAASSSPASACARPGWSTRTTATGWRWRWPTRWASRCGGSCSGRRRWACCPCSW